MLTVKINFLSLDARQPIRATPQAAGWDVFAIEDGVVQGGQRAMVRLGFAIELPDGWMAKLKQRSGGFRRDGLIFNDSPIDSDYRGELFAVVNNTSNWPWHYLKAERIGQLLFERVPEVSWVTVDSLSETERGEGALGSTGR